MKVEHRIHWPQTQRPRVVSGFAFAHHGPRCLRYHWPKSCRAFGTALFQSTTLHTVIAANICVSGRLFSALARLQTTAARAGNWPLCLMTSWRNISRNIWPPLLSNGGQMSQRELLTLGLILRLFGVTAVSCTAVIS